MRTTIEEKRILAVFGCENYQNTIKKVVYGSCLNLRCRRKSIVLLIVSTAVRRNDRERLFHFYQ